MRRRLTSLKTLATWIIILVLGGCAPQAPLSQEPFVSPEPQVNQVTVNLYFGNDNADGLVLEERNVVRRGESLESLVIKELIKGSQGNGRRTIPAEARLLSVKVEDGIAYVDFSKEMQSKHWGGSAGEMMTIGSVVYTMTELPGVKKVQFLIEGKTDEAIWGHRTTSEPIGRGDVSIDAIDASRPLVEDPDATMWKDRSPVLAGDVRAMVTGSFSASQPELAVVAGDQLYLYAEKPQGFRLMSQQKLERYVTALASGDLDGDGRDELIMVGASSTNWNSSVPGFISVYSWDGQMFRRGVDQPHGKVPLDAAGAMDVTSDGKAELMVSNANGMWIYTLDEATGRLRQMHALNRFAGRIATYRDAAGREVLGWTDTSWVNLGAYTWEKDSFKEQWIIRGGASWTGPVFWGDLTGDGEPELAFPDLSGGLSFFSQGERVELDAEVAQKLREINCQRAVLMDTDGDGSDEAILGVGNTLVVYELR